MLNIIVVSTAAELGVVVEGESLAEIRHLGVTGNCSNLLLVVEEADFHSFLGFGFVPAS